MNPTLIIYDTKYGSTGNVAELMAKVLGPATMIRPSEFDESHSNARNVVIGSPVYGEKIMPGIAEFVKEHGAWLSDRRVALFTVSISPKEEYVNQMKSLLGDCVVWQQCFGGVMDPADWDNEDSSAMERFAVKVGHKFSRVDKTDAEFVAKNAIELRRIFRESDQCPEEVKGKRIEEFLNSHNSCTLGTAGAYGVRVTPIEYIYIKGAFYLLSEGGEKFANIEVDNRVSVAVYDPFTGFDKLAGLQVTGRAELIPFESDEYQDVAAERGLEYDKLKEMPIRLNMIKIKVEKYEALMSEFAKQGYDANQILEAGATDE